MTEEELTDPAEIQRLIRTPPPVRHAQWDRAARWLAPISTAIAGAAITLALLSERHSSGVGECVNNNLGIRNGPSARDAQAHIEFATSLARFVTISKADQKAEAEKLKMSIQNYADTLAADQAERDAHPLGQC